MLKKNEKKKILQGLRVAQAAVTERWPWKAEKRPKNRFFFVKNKICPPKIFFFAYIFELCKNIGGKKTEANFKLVIVQFTGFLCENNGQLCIHGSRLDQNVRKLHEVAKWSNILAQAALRAPPEVAFAMHIWPLLLPTFSLLFFFFSVFCFWLTSGKLPCVKICFLQYFGITRRYMQFFSS